MFDLDPDEKLPFTRVIDAALTLRKVLESAGLASFAMLSGGKGIHVIVPLDGKQPWSVIEAFAKRFARRLAILESGVFVAMAGASRRKGRIFIDYMRNKHSATAIVPYSLRAKLGASVAMPVSWRGLRNFKSAAALTAPEVLKRLPADPWKTFFDLKQVLREEMLAAI